MVTWITVGIFPQHVPITLNHHTTISLLIQRFSLNVVVLGKSADILYLFSEPKLLIINPSCTQSLILPPMSSKITSMCRSVTFHPAVILQLTAATQPQNRICDHFYKQQTSTTRRSVCLHTVYWHSRPHRGIFPSPSLADCLVDRRLEVAGSVDVAGVGGWVEGSPLEDPVH